MSVEANIEALADRLAPLLADRLADRLAELVVKANGSGQLIDAVEVARRYAVDRSYVYAHADELGAIRLGEGPRARLRFDPVTVADRLAARPNPLTRPEPKRDRRPRRKGSDVALLPIRGARV